MTATSSLFHVPRKTVPNELFPIGNDMVGTVTKAVGLIAFRIWRAVERPLAKRASRIFSALKNTYNAN